MSPSDRASRNARREASDERNYRGRGGVARKAAARGKVDARRSERRANKALAREASAD